MAKKRNKKVIDKKEKATKFDSVAMKNKIHEFANKVKKNFADMNKMSLEMAIKKRDEAMKSKSSIKKKKK